MASRAISRCHVFAGTFAGERDATAYTEEAWDPEPEKDASDEAYAAWEDANPRWQMRTDLDLVYLDGDFIETITGEERFDYLGTLLTDPDALDRVRRSAAGTNTLVLIFEDALGGFEAQLRSTPKLVYCGAFEIAFS